MPRRLAVIFVALLSLSLLAYSSYYTSPIVSLTIQETSAFSVAPRNISFGETPPATLISPNFTIENEGNTNLTIEIWSNASAADFLGGTGPSFQFNLSDAEAGSCGASIPFTELGTAPVLACPALRFSDATDSLTLVLRLIIPADAVNGSRNATVFIRANGSAGSSILEINVSVIVLRPTGLVTPENISISLGPGFNTNITWSAVPGASLYNIYYFDNCSNISSNLIALAPNATTYTTNFTDSLANSTQQRCYRIAATGGSDTGAPNISVGKFDIALSEGWNFVSTPFNLTKAALGNDSEVGNPLPTYPADVVRTVYCYSAESASYQKLDRFSWGYWPATNSFSFTTLEPNRGYFLEVDGVGGGANLTFVGVVPIANITTNLTEGWNFIGWHSPVMRRIGDSSSYQNPLTTEPAQSAVTLYRKLPNPGYFEKADWLTGYGWYQAQNSTNFTSIEPGKGYWVWASENATWEQDPK